MANRKPGGWGRLEAAQREGSEVAESEAEVQHRKVDTAMHPKYWVHLIGIALLMTQNKLVIAARGADGNTAWVIGMLMALSLGALVAGILHVIKKPTNAQTGRHFVNVSWVVAVLAVLGSYQ